MRSSPTRSTSPAAARSARRSCLTRARANTMPRAVELRREAHPSASIAVRSTSTLASALSTNHSTGPSASVDGGQRPAPEVLGVGEEQRRVVAVDDQPGHLASRPGSRRCRASRRRRGRSRGCRRAGRATRRSRSRIDSATAHQHAVEDAEDAAPPTVVARASTSSLRRNRAIRRNSREVDQPQGGVDDDGAQRGGRERASSGPTNSTVPATTARATSEYSWLRLPSASPITVRLPLLLTGKP